MDFKKKLEKAAKKNNSLLCVGLDPDPQKITRGSIFNFNKKVIDNTFDLVCCYKPQIAFYSAQGILAISDLKKTIEYIKNNYPHVPVILDAKRADIGTTSKMYAKEAFDFFKADALTVNPYLGFDALEPFLNRTDKGIFVLCRTSNSGAKDFQDLKIGKEKLYLKVAKKVTAWDKKYKNLFMVVGATWPEELKLVRKIAKNMTFLVPGIGRQGGDLKKILKFGLKDSGGLIISASSSIIYSQDPRKSAQNLKNEINEFR